MTTAEFKNLSKEEKAKVPFKEWPKGRKRGFTFMISVFALLFVLCIISIATDDTVYTPTESEAFTISKKYIAPLLISPATADFPLGGYSFRKIDDQTFYIESYVDSQNTFGAIVRTKYYVKLKYLQGEWSDSKNWELVEYNLYQ